MILTAFSTALAVTCDSSDVLCSAIDETVQVINDAAGRTLVHEGAVARLRPQAIYNQIASARDALVAGGCLVGYPDQASRHAGVYSIATGTFEGDYVTPLSTPSPIQGTISDGELTYVVPPIGGTARFGGDRKIVGFQNGFTRYVAAGRWIRNQGNNGVFVGIVTPCNGTQRPDQALAGWAQAPLPADFWVPSVPGNQTKQINGSGGASTGFFRPYRRESVVCTSADPAVLQLAGDPVVATVDHVDQLILQLTIAEGESGVIRCGFGTDVADATEPVMTVVYFEPDTGLVPE